MRQLTEREAIDLEIEKWDWLAKTGKWDGVWLGWEKYGHVANDCFLCEFHKQQVYDEALIQKIPAEECEYCPYNKKFGRCFGEGKLIYLWQDAQTPRTRRMYAKLFLEQLRQLTGEAGLPFWVSWWKALQRRVKGNGS